MPWQSSKNWSSERSSAGRVRSTSGS